ncbi:MAG: LGFP repeat-containing protein [Pseudonocardiaceae bacterium]
MIDPAFATARGAIEAKAWALALEFTGHKVGNIESAPGIFADERVFHQRYIACTIYFGPRTGAHKIHGGIRDKYDNAGGLDLPGIPITDESQPPRSKCCPRPGEAGRGQQGILSYGARPTGYRIAP